MTEVSPEIKQRIELICDEFEKARRESPDARIEDYLGQFPRRGREALFYGLLRIEIAVRAEMGQRPVPDPYYERFPQLRSIIDSAFSSSASTQHASRLTGAAANNGGSSSQFDPGDQISGYSVLRKLGEGSFGVVYLARDLTLGRNVALKVARWDAFESTDDIARFRTEAQNAARITHPGVVTIYSVDLDHDPPFIVEEYVEGKDLKALLKEEPPSLVNSVKLVANLAETISHAHQQGIYHRDLKPGNILIAADGRARIVDFGLALQEDERHQSRWERCGTPLYMSPEQVRGESHRLDGRSDIWSLGAILYELVVGQRPFEGMTREELYEVILHKDVRPPRQLKPQLPVELERICLKCLEKRMSDRYTTAADLAADLRELLTDWNTYTAADPLPVSSRPSAGPVVALPKGRTEGRVQIVPKGLRAFDEHDADFFLELVPGPGDRHGLPEAIRFWKYRVEETDADSTFPVGVIYGPSGCGKSSLVRAGLLPRLSERVIALYVEAGQDETSTTRLVNQLYKQFPSLPPGLELRDAIAELRVGTILPANTKVLLVLDQFEQWLHSTTRTENSSLVQALRQCDGGRVQALILVRDDFWLAVSRFMRQLEVPIIEGENSALVDLFDPDHAARVLGAFGRAYGRLPVDPDATTADQRAFISQAVDALAEVGKVNCVRLALLAEMMKGKPWTPANLKRMGGVEGVGVAFLEDRFSSATAPPKCRLHQQAARAVLARLLPEPGANIRGHRRAYSDLLQASAYAAARDFAELLQILDFETRLITPSDSAEAAGSPGEDRRSGEKCYQLTHDYLVPSLREWLTQKKRETHRGRAELRLADRSELWNARREKNQLPSGWETLNIACLTARRNWTTGQRRMMKAATRLHLRRLSTLVLVICTVGAAGLVAWSRSSQHDRQQEADHFVAQVLVSDVDRFESLLEQMPTEQALWRARLQAIADDPLRDTAERTRAHLVLVRHDPASVPYLMEQMQKADLRHALQIQSALGLWPAEALPRVWAAISTSDRPDSALLRLGVCLAQHAPDSNRWSTVAEKVAGALVTANQLEVGAWMTALEPAKRWLLEPLAARLRDTKAGSSQRTMAAEILAHFGSDSPETLAVWILEAGPEQFPALYASLNRRGSRASELLAEQLQSTRRPTDFEAIEKQMRAAMALLLLGEADRVWPLLRQTAEPGLRTSLVSSMKDYGVPADMLVRELESEHPTSVRSALLLALGKYQFNGSQPLFDEAAVTASRIYQHDPDSGVHSASEWLLKMWGAELPQLPRTPLPGKSDQQWWVNSEGHTMVAQLGPVEFTMGSPETEAGRDDIETPKREVINHSFAISAHEVTIEQCLRFDPAFQFAPQIGVDPQCPVNRVSWFDALRYCRWLSEQEGIAEDQMCYPPREQIGLDDVVLPDELLSRTGYRLPTEAEWEYMCRAGSQTPWFFGADASYLRDYCWYSLNTAERSYPVGTMRPNPLGLFDIYGNIEEWCQDLSGIPTTSEEVSKLALGIDVRAGERILKGGYYRAMIRGLRSAKRQSFPPTSRFSYLGFRIARTLP